jgi:hypothetical protein
MYPSPVQQSVFSHMMKYFIAPLRSSQLLVPVLLSLVLWGAGEICPQPGRADSPESAPPELKTTLAQIDSAANSKNVNAVLQFYSPSFSNSDGLNRAGLEKSLTGFWSRFAKLNYRTDLKSWSREGNTLVAETLTNITGTQVLDGRNLSLQATIRSRQSFANNQVMKQEIIAEQSQITSGQKPPAIDVTLPEKVKVGQEFQFDAVVKEPLGENLLLAGAFEKPVNLKDYLNEGASGGDLKLELLTAGGLFKIGKAPNTPQNLWISAIFMREDGINILTQRLQVTPK